MKLNKPLIIHTRNAREDTLSILRNGHADRGGVIHCFTEDLPLLKRQWSLILYFDLGDCDF